MRTVTTLLLAFLFLLAGTGDLHAQQNSYYWSGGKKITLKQDRSSAVLIYKDAAVAQGRALAARGFPDAQVFAAKGGKQVVLQFDRPRSGALATVLQDAQQVDHPNLKWFSYGYRNRVDVEYLPTHRIVFELKEGRTLSEVRALAPKAVQFESATYFRYAIAQSPTVDLLALANRIYESGLVKYAHPDFMVEKQRTSDPLYSKQYYLNSTSSNLGTADVDIDAPGAWNLTKGSSQIRVAVIDDGVEAHEDLEDASGNSRVLNGYTPQTGGNGRPTFDRRTDEFGRTEIAGHGVACAGIVAAPHNSKGIRGVAPKVKIVPINIFNGGIGNRETPSEIADGINWAWDEGEADVLSNSWGYPPSAYFDVIEDAIADARTQGRNGKGSVVVFAAGNFTNGSQVSDATFPADVDGVLGVGAVDKNDNRWYYTPSAGSDIDIVAPSGDVNLNGDVRTTDRMGDLGYETLNSTNTNDVPVLCKFCQALNYTERFGGTSAAAPQAAGVAALMLSVNGSLTESEVRSKIEANADDYGSTNWDGDGRLNARDAVEAAVPPLYVTVTGPVHVIPNVTYTWTASASGGIGSYTFYWQQSGGGIFDPINCGNDASCEGSFSNSDPYLVNGTIRAIVTDAAGLSAQDDLPITIGAGGASNASRTSADSAASSNGTLSASASGEHSTSTRSVPEEFALAPGYPNPVPAGQRVTIPFALPEAAEVTLEVYDVLGRPVRRIERGTVGAGHPRVVIGTQGLSGGVYVYRLTAGGTSGEPFSGTGKLIVVK